VLLALGATAIVMAVLLWELLAPHARAYAPGLRRALVARLAPARDSEGGYDPGRELRAEQRARALLRSCVNEEEWAMYRDLGFLRVWGGSAGKAPRASSTVPYAASHEGSDAAPDKGSDVALHAGSYTAPHEAPYAYLIYPHRPIVAFIPQTGVLLNEYCVAFPDLTRPYGSARLPDSDDVLAKWMALTADERRLIADANMHLPGRQLDPDAVRRDLARLSSWERERIARAPGPAGSVPAP
jgi:hypothetical protein